LTFARRRGRGLVFFIQLFFHYWVAKEGVRVFFILICWRGVGGGGGWVFFTSSFWGEGGVKVGLIHFILAKIN
jgi:hypothetical protein